MNKNHTPKIIIILFAIFSMVLLTACGTDAEAKVPTVLIVNPLGATLQDFVDGFIEGMAEAGYTDGETVHYVYSEVPEAPAPPAVEATITTALANQKPAMVVCVSTLACTITQPLLVADNIPLLFMGVTDPISTGLVTDFTETEAATGIASAARNAANEGRAFEWLLQVAPDTRKVYIPHNPTDPATSVKISTIQGVADAMDVELVIFEVAEEADLDAALQAIPDDADAIITVSERIFTVPFMTALNAIAIERNLPHLSFSINYGQMMSYSPDTKAIGTQAAVLGGRILDGTPVSDLPVEVPEFKLYINLPTVDAMGFTIDSQILRQAVVVRAGEE